MSLDDDLDALFTAPLADFVARRKELATALRKAGDKEEASRVAALARPTPAAWAVNALWRSRGAEVEALLELGERLRGALRASFAGKADGRAGATLQLEQRAAIDRLVRAAEDLLAKSGTTASSAVLEKVAATLRAISTTGSWDDATPGRLARELATPDLATLAALLVTDGTPRTRPAARATPPRAAAVPESAERPTGAAEDRARAAQIESTEAALARAQEREQAAKEAADRAAAVVRRAQGERDAAASEVAGATRAVADADAAVREAEKAAEAARSLVRTVEKKHAAADHRVVEAEDRAARAARDASEAQLARETARDQLAALRLPRGGAR